MIRRLTAFYESHGISPVDFRCPSRSECAAGSPDFTEAKMSFVPPRYGMGDLPRLLFLSLDSGSGSSDPRERTAEAVRQWIVECDVAALPKNKHWYRTHELAFELLRQFKPDLTVPDTRLYFAHVNSAKCCQNKSGRKRADSILFENCRRFIPGELALLSPDVVVTQGGPARTAIVQSFSVRRHDVRRRGQRQLCVRCTLRNRRHRTRAGKEAVSLDSDLPPQQLWTLPAAAQVLLASLCGSGRSVLGVAGEESHRVTAWRRSISPTHWSNMT